MLKYIIFFVFLGARVATAQFPYSVGYRAITMRDSGRVYKPGTGTDHPLHYRPLEIDLWYPAIRANPDTTVRFGRYISLLEQRADRFQDDTVYTGLTREIVGYLCANLQLDSNRLMHLPTGSHANAMPVPGKFPLLLYLCSFNGISYENVPLFEFLAGHGYVVASITSVGRYPGNMSTKVPDLLEQVDDGLFAMKMLANESNVDGQRIGAIGYSWGGLAAFTLAMNCNPLRAVLSLDGSELHYYGGSSEEDKDFDAWRASAFFRPGLLKTPYAYLESGGKQKDRLADSIFDPLLTMRAPTWYLHFSRAAHEDFSCFPELSARLSTAGAALPPIPFDKLTLYFFDRYLKDSAASHPDPRWIARADSVHPAVSVSRGRKLILTGKVVDSSDKSPLAYVNVGIPGKNIGTVSRQDGSWELPIGEDFRQDSIQFSMAGYKPANFLITGLAAATGPVVVQLHVNAAQLAIAVVSSKIAKTRRLGNSTRSTFVSVGFPLRSLGTEMGIRIDLGKKPVRLRRLQFNLSASRVDTALFRLNIHRFQNGNPGDNLLERNIVVPVGKKIGAYSVGLSGYDIVLKGEVLVSLEWIGGSTAAGPGVIFFSAGFLNSATWRRETSQGDWKKATGIGVGLSLDVQNAPCIIPDAHR